MKNWLKLLSVDLIAVVLGMLLTFAYAPYEIFPFAILAPAGLLTLWLKVTPKRAFWLGFIFGLAWFGTGVYWVFHSIHTIGQVSTWLALIITGGMISILACYPGFVGFFLNRYFPVNNTTKILCAFPAIWVLSEWIRSWLFTGFPWLFLGYSQTNSPLRGYAPWLSVYGVTLAVVLTSAWLVDAMIQYKKQNFSALYKNLFSILTMWVLGALFCLIPWTTPVGKPLTVSLVQGNIPQSIKWSPEHLKLSLQRYADLTEPLWGKSKIIIWPEAAVPLPLQIAASYINNLDEKARASGSQLILGIPIKAPKQSGYYNAVITLGADRTSYLKRRLVPFGEYTPFEAYFSRTFNFLNIPLSEMITGDAGQEPLTVENTKIETSICYEVAFPELLKTRDKTLGLLLTVTNDAWFGKSNAQAQHLQMAEMRAIELARPLLFSSNDGITAIIAPDGKISAVAPAHTTTVLTGTVQAVYGMTPWMRNGMDPLVFILICLLFTAYRNNKMHLTRALSNKPSEEIMSTNQN